MRDETESLTEMLRCLPFLISFSLVRAATIQALGSSANTSWTLSSSNGSTLVNATVPGVAHLDLLAAGLIGEPYAELNVDAQSWVKDEPFWVFSCAFTPNAGVLASTFVELVADGIDAVASVSLNEVVLWEQADAFTRNIVDVTAALRSGTNTLTVRIASPTRAALAANASCVGFCPYRPWGSPDNASSYDQAFAYVRKPGVFFGWDFAPNLNPSGVWRPIYLRATEGAALDSVAVVTTPAALPVPLLGTSAWTAVVTVYVTAAARAAGATAVVNVSVAGLSGGDGSAAATLAIGDNAISVTLEFPAALAWWPAGLGAPTLFNATVSVHVLGDVFVDTLRLGFRTVALRQPPVGGGDGAALFFFEVNGHGLVVKGANWVPADAFAPRAAARSQLAPKIASFAAAHYNALRVWGGGHPQPDVFYELAQEAGLLIWHEMPYACVGYPTGVDALPEATAEATFIVRRLQKYSVLMWGGNNEIAQINGKGWPPGSPGSSNYSELFLSTIGTAVAAADASRPYVPTSPGSGEETPSAPIAFPAMTPTRGDMHVYVYDGDCMDPTRYPRARAASEFGWQSYSGLPSMAEVIGPAGFDFWSPPVQRRDTHASQPPDTILFHNVGMNWLIPGYNGTGGSEPGARDARLAGNALAEAVSARAAGMTSTAYTRRADGTFSLPTDALGIVPMMSAYGGGGAVRGTVFRDTLLLTQFSHAACLRTEAESYRRAQSECDAAGGCTAVILYWMAADIWPAATKGSIEWSGRWKATHYEAARGFLAPLLISPWSVPLNASMTPALAPFGVTLAAHPPASLRGAVPAGLVRVSCWSWATGHLGDADTPFSIAAWPNTWGLTGAAGGAVEIINSTLGVSLESCGCGAPLAPAECILVVAAFNSSTASDASRLARGVLLPVPPRAFQGMRDPGLLITDVATVPDAPGAFDVTLTAAVLPAANVWLESLLCCGYFSDNNFVMTDASLVLRYTPLPDARGWAHAPPQGAELNVTAGQFAASLSIMSLWDTAAYDA